MEISASASASLACASRHADRGKLGGHAGRADLVDLVDDADRRVRIGDAQPAVEALQHLAVVDLDPDLRDRQAAQHVRDDQRQLGLVVRRAACRGRRCRCRPAGTRDSAPPAGAPRASTSGSDSAGTGTAACPRSPARSARTARSGRSAGQACCQRRRPRRPAAGAAGRPLWTSRLCAAVDPAARRRASPMARSRKARKSRRARSMIVCSIIRCGGNHSGKPEIAIVWYP